MDYNSLPTELMFQPTETARCISVVINNDEILENDETFQVTLLSGISGLILSPPVATFTIRDNDGALTLLCQHRNIFYADCSFVHGVFRCYSWLRAD